MRCLVVTTPSIEGRRVTNYLGLVSGEAILGANIFRDLFAGIRDIVGGRSAAYEQELRKAKSIAIQEMEEQAGGARRQRGAGGGPGLRNHPGGIRWRHAHGERERHGGGRGVSCSSR